jgi:hypothetical protein
MTKARLLIPLLVAAHVSLDAVVAAELWLAESAGRKPNDALVIAGVVFALSQIAMLCIWLLFGKVRFGWRLAGLFAAIGLLSWILAPADGVARSGHLRSLFVTAFLYKAATIGILLAAARYCRRWQLVISESDSSTVGVAHRGSDEEASSRDTAHQDRGEAASSRRTSTDSEEPRLRLPSAQWRIADFLLYTAALAIFLGLVQTLPDWNEIVVLVMRRAHMILLVSLASTLSLWFVLGDGLRRLDGWLAGLGSFVALANWSFTTYNQDPGYALATLAQLTVLLLSLTVLRIAGLRLVVRR